MVKTHNSFSCCALVSERTAAYWYSYVSEFRRIERFATDLFRLHNGSDFYRAPKVGEPWIVLGLKM